MSCTPSRESPVSPVDESEVVVHNIPDSQLITANASELVLNELDVPPGWVQTRNQQEDKLNAQSAYYVSFTYKIGILHPIMKNWVAVYPSIDLAEQGYQQIIYQNGSLEYPDIGDECFLDISASKNTFLVFRQNNVVVSLWFQEDKFNEVMKYAGILDNRIYEVYEKFRNST
jgi:hypothetical protein